LNFGGKVLIYARLYGGAFLVCVGDHLVAGNGPDIIVAGLCLIALWRVPLGIYVVHFDGDADPEGTDGVERDSSKDVVEVPYHIAPQVELVEGEGAASSSRAHSTASQASWSSTNGAKFVGSFLPPTVLATSFRRRSRRISRSLRRFATSSTAICDAFSAKCSNSALRIRETAFGGLTQRRDEQGTR
jgi:hypothetical protein